MGQQLWEFLAILIALRLWIDPLPIAANTRQCQSRSIDAGNCLHSKRVHLLIRGDNVGSLTLAREVALCLAKMSLPPRTEHTPGVAHVLADRLSRACPDDDSTIQVHLALVHVVRHWPVARNKKNYLTLNEFRCDLMQA